MTENFKEKIVIAQALKVRLFAQYWGMIRLIKGKRCTKVAPTSVNCIR